MLNIFNLTDQYPIYKLSELVTFLDNQRKPVKAIDRIEGDYPYYGANGQQGTINDYIFDETLILLAEDGGHFADSKRPIAYIAEGKYWVNNHAHVLRPNTGVELRYLYWILAFYNVMPFIKGATRAKLSKTDASKIPIPLPPIKTQKRIVSLLDRAQALIDKRKEQIALMDQLIQSIFYDMFGDPTMNPKKWNRKRFKEFFAITTGKLDANVMVEGGEYPFFTCAKEVYAIDKYAFEQEALLLSGNNATGNYDVKYYSGKFNAYQRTYVLTIKENDEYMFAKFLLEHQLLLLKSMSNRPRKKNYSLYMECKNLHQISRICVNNWTKGSKILK